jgi:hypothetical protein
MTRKNQNEANSLLSTTCFAVVDVREWSSTGTVPVLPGTTVQYENQRQVTLLILRTVRLSVVR